MSKLTVIMEVRLPEQIMFDILTTAIEGGINYWANEDGGVESVKRRDSDHIVTSVTLLADYGGTKPINRKIGAQQIADAIAKMASDATGGFGHTLADIFKSVDSGGCGADANSCDNVFQMAAFGSIVFG